MKSPDSELDNSYTSKDIQIRIGLKSQKISIHLNLAQHFRMATTIQSCQTKVSTIFVYGEQARQTAANSIYLSKKGEYTSSIAGTLPAGQTHSVNLVFKTDYERMQYLIGLYGRSSQGLQ